MKRVLLLCTVLLLCFGVVRAQTFEAKTQMIVGTLAAQHKAPSLGLLASVNVNMYQDSAAGFTSYVQEGVFYSNAAYDSTNVEANAIVSWNRKTWYDAWGTTDLNVGLGLGYVHDFAAEAPEDRNLLTVTALIGANVGSFIDISLHGWFFPQGEKVFAGIGINLVPF